MKRAIWYKRINTKEKEQVEVIFHCFVTDFIEFETGPGQYSTAIIELKNGALKNVPVEHITLIGKEKSEIRLHRIFYSWKGDSRVKILEGAKELIERFTEDNSNNFDWFKIEEV